MTTKEDLLEKIEKSNEELEEAELENMRLQNTLSKEKEANLIWKERIQQLNLMHRRVTKSHATSMFSKRKAINNLILGQNETILFKKEVQMRHDEYQLQMSSLQSIYAEIKREIEEMVDNISANALNQNERKKENLDIIQRLEKQIFTYNESLIEKERLNSMYKNYQEQMKTISKVIERHNMPLYMNTDSPGLEGIINMYKYMIYQETSLSSRFQELTLDFLELQKQYEDMETELNILKKSTVDFPYPETQLPNTFNHMKFSLEDMESLTSNFEYTESHESLVIKLYLIVLNLAILGVNSLKQINEKVHCIKLENEQEYINALGLIEEFQKGFLRKREVMTSKSPIQNNRLYKNEVNEQVQEGLSIENFKRDVMPYISLKLDEITRSFENIFGVESDAKLFAKLVKQQPIITYFIDIKSVEKYMYVNSVQTENSQLLAFSNIGELTTTGHQIFKRQFSKLMSGLLPLLLKLTNKQRLESQEIAEFMFRHPKKLEL